jgi:hypothetical protein
MLHLVLRGPSSDASTKRCSKHVGPGYISMTPPLDLYLAAQTSAGRCMFVSNLYMSSVCCMKGIEITEHWAFTSVSHNSGSPFSLTQVKGIEQTRIEQINSHRQTHQSEAEGCAGCRLRFSQSRRTSSEHRRGMRTRRSAARGVQTVEQAEASKH